jgi:pimeloyl-[acyl-carrier protein] methyl ester esterase
MSTINLTQNGNGPPLVLLHGWGFDHTIWSTILPKLTLSHTVYCVDLPGFGATPEMPWDNFKTTLFTQLPNKITCVGWSMGGLIATRLALEHPERISRLINITSSPCFVTRPTWPGIQAANLDAFYENLEHAPQATYDAFIALQLPKNTPHRPHTQSLPTGLKAGLDILKYWDFRDNLHYIKPPTTYLFGRLDAIVPVKTMDFMQKTYPKFNYHLFRKTAHAPFLSHPDKFLSVLTPYLEPT